MNTRGTKKKKRWNWTLTYYWNITPPGYLQNIWMSQYFLGIYNLSDLHPHTIVQNIFAEYSRKVFVSIDWCVTVTRPVWNSVKSGSCLWSAASLSFNKSSPVTQFSNLSLSLSLCIPCLSGLVPFTTYLSLLPFPPRCSLSLFCHLLSLPLLSPFCLPVFIFPSCQSLRPSSTISNSPAWILSFLFPPLSLYFTFPVSL